TSIIEPQELHAATRDCPWARTLIGAPQEGHAKAFTIGGGLIVVFRSSPAIQLPQVGKPELFELAILSDVKRDPFRRIVEARKILIVPAQVDARRLAPFGALKRQLSFAAQADGFLDIVDTEPLFGEGKAAPDRKHLELRKVGSLGNPKAHHVK